MGLWEFLRRINHKGRELMEVEQLLMWRNSICGENIDVKNYGGGEIVEVEKIINVEK